jgi:hypothetical protein
VIAATTPSDGHYTWTLPQDLALGEDYTIQVSQVGGATVTDTSDTPFKVIQDHLQTKLDFNGDGNTDIFWHNYGQKWNDNYPLNTAWLLDGQGGRQGSTTLDNTNPTLDPAWYPVASGDFNHDGQNDIIWRYYWAQQTGHNHLWLLNGDQIETHVDLDRVDDRNWHIVGTGDFDQDGNVDIVWHNYRSGSLDVWRMDGTTRLETVHIDNNPVPEANLDHRIVGTGDFNADGKVDLLWRNAATGHTYAWLLDGFNHVDTVDFNYIFQDNFDREANGQSVGNYNQLSHWRVSDGTIDVVGPGHGELPTIGSEYGSFLDLDGSSADAGRLETKTAFNLEPGTYTLAFDLAGSQRGDHNTVTVSLGNVFNESFSLASDAPFQTITRTLNVATPTSGTLVFEHEGQDNRGLLLDNVGLRRQAVNGDTAHSNDLNWRPVATGDYTNDGHTDILWRHSLSGVNTIWKLDGHTRVGDIALPSEPEANWQVAAQTDPIPVWKAEYYDNPDLQGAPVFTEWLGSAADTTRTGPLTQNWGSGSPDSTVPQDLFSARITTDRYLEPGLYRVSAGADDEIQVKIGDEWVINQWDRPLGSFTGYFYSEGGFYPVTIDTSENFGSAAFSFNLELAPDLFEAVDTNQHWNARFFDLDNTPYDAVPNFPNGEITTDREIGTVNLGSNQRADGKAGIQFNWGRNAADNSRLPHDNFGILAHTQYQFDGGEYKFQAGGDDFFQVFAKEVGTERWFSIQDGGVAISRDQMLNAMEWQSNYAFGGNGTEYTAQLPPRPI